MRPLLIACIAKAGQGDSGCASQLGQIAQSAHQVVAIHLRHADVRNDQVKLALFRYLEGLQWAGKAGYQCFFGIKQ